MSRKANVFLAAAVGVIFVIAVVAAVVAVRRDPVVLDPGSPEASVQAYLAALAAGDYTAALDQLAEDSECGLDDLTAGYVPESLEVVLVSSKFDSAGAVVTVRVTEFYGEGLFESSGYSHNESLLLSEEAGGWRLRGTPWPMYECRGAIR